MSTATGTAQSPDNNDYSDVLEERLIDAEYKIWKKNTPYLYDFVMTHSLEWPSLTCQWLPTCKNLPVAGESAAVEHSMIIGTHTTGEQNYLMVASVNLPLNDVVVKETEDAAQGERKDESKAMDTDDAKTTKTPVATFPAANYQEDKNEVGGFGSASSASSSAVGKIEIRMKVKHEGEVNRARYMPQNHFVVASRGPNAEVYLWDLTKHSSFPEEQSAPSPQAVLVGHSKEGYGLAWSPHKEGNLITGSEDTTVCLWDVQSVLMTKGSTNGTQIKPVTIFAGHEDVVEDVDWHHRDPNLIGSVGDDKTIRIWDVRENGKGPVHTVVDAHAGDINSIAFNPVNEFLLATGSADKTVALWDMRNMKK